MNTNRASLRSRLRKAILVPTSLAIALTLLATILFGWLNYHNTIEQTRSDLLSKTNFATRRLSAELLIGSRGAPYAVTQTLKSELRVPEIEFSYQSSPCTPKSSRETCVTQKDKHLSITGIATGIGTSAFVTLSARVPSLRESIPLNVLLWAALPIFLFIGLGICIQQRQLRKYFMRPIESIIAKTVTGADIPKHWPKEFVRLHSELDEAFQRRDQAIIGQIASGVIHDLKTLLQPLSGATQLASEARDKESQIKKLEMLYKACERNLPKMQRILEAVLDGNRDIRLQPRSESLVATLESALKSATEATTEGAFVEVETLYEEQDINIDHDPVQLERALTNLIKNGIEASSLSEKQKRIRIELKRTAGKVPILTIEDSGPGLPVAFENLLASRKSSKLRGTGLGLLVSKKIIEAHRWTIQGDNAGSLPGARITITLERSASA